MRTQFNNLLYVRVMILSVIKYGLFVVFAFFGILQTFIYKRLKRDWETFPLVAATITESRLFDLTDSSGSRSYEALIKFKYCFREKEYQADTPALRGVQLFPQYGFEHSLLDKYKEGEMYNARVHPELPDIAYLEIEPLSKKSMILVPLVILGYFAYLAGIGIYLTRFTNVF